MSTETARDELKAKLAAKIAAFKIMREPKPMTDAPISETPVVSEPAPVSKKRELEVKEKAPKPKKVKTEKAVSKPKQPLQPEPAKPTPPLFPGVKESLSFGNFSFGQEAVDTRVRVQHGSKKVKIGKEIKAVRQFQQALKNVEKSAGLEAKLSMSKQASLEKAIKRAAGKKVRDDVGKLKKTLNQAKVKKQKSAQAWAKRLETVSEDKSARQAKREENIEKYKMKKKPTLEAEPADKPADTPKDGKKLTRKERQKLKEKSGNKSKNPDYQSKDKSGDKGGKKFEKKSFDKKDNKKSGDRKFGNKKSGDRKFENKKFGNKKFDKDSKFKKTKKDNNKSFMKRR